MHLSIALASLLGVFTVIHAVPIQHSEVHNKGKMMHKALRKRDYYDRLRDSRYYDDRYGRYNKVGYNPEYFRSSYPPYRDYSMAATNRVYSPQYYTQPQYTNGYSEAEIQKFIADAAIAAASAVATPNSATPGTAVPAGTNSYDTILTTNDANVLFGTSAATNAQPGFNTGDTTIATPVQANFNPPPQA